MNVQTPPKLRHPEKAHKPDNAVSRKPRWIRQKKIVSNEYYETRRLMRDNELATVCEEAACPNVGECWSKRHATMMIMGETCTRGCSFCNVTTGKPDALDTFEPGRVARAVKTAGPAPRGDHQRGSRRPGRWRSGTHRPDHSRRASPEPGHHRRSVDAGLPGQGRRGHAVFAAAPDVFNHNLETVPRLYPTVRPGARYYQSLRLLDDAKRANPSLFTKSGLMVGLEETMEEVRQVMDDLRAADVDFLTVGQYLQPTPKHHPVDRFWTPEEFETLERIARAKGFLGVSATPLTRSSFHADEDFAALKQAREAALAARA